MRRLKPQPPPATPEGGNCHDEVVFGARPRPQGRDGDRVRPDRGLHRARDDRGPAGDQDGAIGQVPVRERQPAIAAPGGKLQGPGPRSFPRSPSPRITHMTKLMRALAAHRKGATAIEYGLIAAFIALAMVVALPGIHDALSAKFQSVNAQLQ